MAQRNLSAAEQEFFTRFFDACARAAVPAIVVRNYEQFPTAIGHDIDVFFRRADLELATELFTSELAAARGAFVHLHERDYVRAVWFRIEPGSDPLHVDFYHGVFTWHGLAFLDEAPLLGAALALRNFRIPRPAHEALSLFVTGILWGGFFREVYRERLRELLASDAERTVFDRQLLAKFGTAGSPPFDFLEHTMPDAGLVRSYAWRLRRALFCRAFLADAGETLTRWTRYWRREFALLFHPPGLHVVIYGPDGAGKSTLISGLRARVESLFGSVVERHWRPSILPDVGVALRKRKRVDGPVTDPHGARPHSRSVSTLRALYYWLDYWLGWLPLVRKAVAQNKLVIFDRYAGDMWCDPRRFRFDLPADFLRKLTRFVPKPDVVFVLVAEPEVLRARKAEVSSEAAAEAVEKYRALARDHGVREGGRVVVLDAARAPAEISDEAARALEELLHSRLPVAFREVKR